MVRSCDSSVNIAIEQALIRKLGLSCTTMETCQWNRTMLNFQAYPLQVGDNKHLWHTLSYLTREGEANLSSSKHIYPYQHGIAEASANPLWYCAGPRTVALALWSAQSIVCSKRPLVSVTTDWMNIQIEKRLEINHQTSSVQRLSSWNIRWHTFIHTMPPGSLKQFFTRMTTIM